MPTTMPATVPTGVPPPCEGATVTVAGDVGCGAFNADDAGVVVVEGAVDKVALLAVLSAAVAEDDDDVVEASLMLK